MLEVKIQAKADASTAWIRDNEMVCSGGKTKLMVMGTREMRSRKYETIGRKLRVKVEDKIVEESTDEKLLGIVINHNLSWSTHRKNRRSSSTTV